MTEQQHADTPMADVEEDFEFDTSKLTILPTQEDSERCATYRIENEDHTLGNALKYMLTKNPNVEFCGYDIPHPTATFINLRIQTNGKQSAAEALHNGLDQLAKVCDHMIGTFQDALDRDDYELVDAPEA
ncbi:RNA polymerase subunit AC19 [Sorochytrium milnesiophthora]